MLKILGKDSFAIVPAKEKLTNKQLVVIVQSRPNAFLIRQANRNSWAKMGMH